MVGRTGYLFGFVICLCLTTVLCDYPCICIDISTLSVLPYDNEQAAPLGRLYKDDCKPTLTNTTAVLGTWITIPFHNQIGYLQYNEYVHMETCSGQSVVDEIAIQPTLPTTVQIHTTKTDSPISRSTSPVTSSSATYTTETSTPLMTTHTDNPISVSRSTSPVISSTTHITSQAGLNMSITRDKILEGHYATVTVPPDVLKGDISGCPKLPNRGGANIMTQYQDNCYEIMTTSRYSYQFAETHCKIRGGHLVTIPNLVIEEYLRQILLTWFNNPVWIGYNNVSGHAQWTSGASINYTNLAGQSGVQTVSGNNMSCAVYDTRGSVGVWELHDCTEKFSYICQYLFSGSHSSVAPVTQAYRDPLERCRNKLGIYNDSVQTDGVHCYKSIQSIRTIYTDSMQQCYNLERLCGSSHGTLVRPSPQILRALVPNNVFVTVPGYSAGLKRFIDTPNGCVTLKLKSDGILHNVFFRQTITTYSVCRYDL